MEMKFRRFTLNQRVEHMIFFTTFILLAYTGFPLMFPDEWWSKWMIASVGGFDNRTFIHHSAGLLMIGVGAYHVVFHVLEKPRFNILFNPGDIRNFLQQVRYSFRYSDEHPKSGRYTWKQKFEYFGAGFGAVIMGFTGILMWKPFEAMQYFPIGFIQIANLFHTWEAVLASLAIFIGHFYDEHLGKFPNMSWLTGNISEEEMLNEHPLEYEAATGNVAMNIPVSHTSGSRMVKGIAKLLFAVIFLVLSVWMLWIAYQVLAEAVRTYIL